MGEVAGSDNKTCPKAPNPCADARLEAEEKAQGTADSMLVVDGEEWDFALATATGAVKLLITAVSALAEITGDVPPTPPASRPTTPSEKAFESKQEKRSEPRYPMSPVSPVSPASNNGTAILPVAMPSPEAHRDEPIPEVGVGAQAETRVIQQMAISRRFFLKTVPPFTLSQYLLRLHQYCPHSPGVYLTAAAYVHRLCVTDTLVPATNKTIHRVCLAAIRVASKALEDHKWSQDRVAKVGGVSRKELKSLEVNLCFLLDFDLFVREAELKRRVYELQEAAKQGISIKKRLSISFGSRLPVRTISEATEVG
ncbi:cyclin-domain-containing protein [Elsinoe ampelina]|uniref:Cyclin-domain-containing protein n=1 Tax=Elsinoe ampelina TaxID=302913 RepID=A0A6A6GDS2_9PEZI|nr:cyclin-domain-containing protein [Elsinoe ampelina]